MQGKCVSSIQDAQLASEGLLLAAELAAWSETFHTKSDQCDILGYEAIRVREMAEALLAGSPDSQISIESTLFGPWGRSFAWGREDLLQKAKAFRETYAQRQNA